MILYSETIKRQDLLTALQAYEEAHGDLREVIDINHTKEYENLHLTKQGEHTRAYIKVQDGCNQFCSYCIIPYARGRVRSRAKEDVVAEVTDLAKNGYQEVVLTGIHLSSYGIDFENEDNLLSLIRAVHEIEGIKRIRLGSLEPRINHRRVCTGDRSASEDVPALPSVIAEWLQ